MSNQIHLTGEYFRREEDTAAATIKPGYLLEKTSAGKVQAHSMEGGWAERAFAIEDALQGDTTSDSYSADDEVSYNLEQPGNVVQAWLKAGENVSKGDALISAGDGTLIKNGSEGSSTTVRQIIAYAEEALDLSDSGDTATLMDVRVA
jgi:hypothetical protein